MRFILDSGSVGSRETLHRTLAAGLHFPDWYGGNLDALHDCLTELAEPTELVIRNSRALAETLGGYVLPLRRVLADCAAENGLLSVVWEEDAP